MRFEKNTMKEFLSGHHSVKKWNNLYWIICVLLFPCVVFFSFCRPWQMNHDFWEYAPAIRELSINFLHPSNPMLQMPGNTSLRFVPYTMFWGLFKKVTHVNIFLIMGLAGVTNYVIFTLGLYRFIARQFKSDTLPGYALLTMLFVWGIGYPWGNAYHLEMFFINLPYLGFFSFGLSLNALYYLTRYCQENTWRDFFLYSILAVVSSLSHPPTGGFCFAAGLAVLLSYKNVIKAFLLACAPLLMTLVAFLIWPYFSYLDFFLKRSIPRASNDEIKFIFKHPLFSNQISALGVAMIGFPIALFYALKRKYLFVVYGLLLCLLTYTVSFFVGITIGSRFILFLTFFLHLAIALYIKEQNTFTIQTLKQSLSTNAASLILIAMLVVLPLDYRFKEMKKHLERIIDRPFQLHSYRSPSQPYFFLSEYLSESDIVLASVEEGWVVPTITGAKLVARLKTYSVQTENYYRTQDVTAFFNSALSFEERQEILEKYHVTHVMLNLKNETNWDSSFMRDLKIVGTEIARNTTITEGEDITENTVILYNVATSSQ